MIRWWQRIRQKTKIKTITILLNVFTLQSQYPEAVVRRFFKIAVLKNYIIFTGKRKCCSLFNNVEGLVCNFIIICEIFKNRVFHRTSLVAASGQMSFLRLLVTFYTPIKTLENPDVFRGHKKTSGMKWIKAS